MGAATDTGDGHPPPRHEGGPGSYELTTDHTGALAEALNEAGLEPLSRCPWGRPSCGTRSRIPTSSGNSLYLFFGPVLPHGEAIFLGPG